jgi:DNA-directed RNA polymerase
VNGISPNFVHSMDSAHLMRTVNRCVEEGIVDFAMVHDSFGCHAGDIDVMHKVLRTEFVDMYRVDWMREFREEIQAQVGDEIPAAPPMGTLDLNGVMESDFFFS